MLRPLSILFLCFFIAEMTTTQTQSAQLLVEKRQADDRGLQWNRFDIYLLTLAADGSVQERPLFVHPDGSGGMQHLRQIRSFVFEGGGLGMFIGSLSDGRIRAFDVTFPPEPFRDLSFSPDGEWLAFGTTNAKGNPVVAVSRIDGSERRVLHLGEKPAWSPDGRTIAFQSNAPDGFAVADVQTGDFQLIRPNATFLELSWSPDGEWFAFVDATGDVFTMRPDGSDIQNATHEMDKFAHGGISWTPDNRIVFLGGRDPNGAEGWQVIDPDGSSRRVFLPFPADSGPMPYARVLVVGGALPGAEVSLGVSPVRHRTTTWATLKAR